jgi:hypothetical protein
MKYNLNWIELKIPVCEFLLCALWNQLSLVYAKINNEYEMLGQSSVWTINQLSVCVWKKKRVGLIWNEIRKKEFFNIFFISISFLTPSKTESSICSNRNKSVFFFNEIFFANKKSYIKINSRLFLNWRENLRLKKIGQFCLQIYKHNKHCVS